MSGLLLWRLQRFPGTRLHFALLATRWFYFTNHGYAGERRYFVRVVNWRRNFGPVRP